jgi:medium-chain acyl-[acyl-carrier-protein] hydrolase
MKTASLSRWVPPYCRPNPAARIRLFCFPYAGGGASVFLPWSNRIGKDVDVWPIQLPGRENRVSEPCLVSVDDVVTGIADDPDLGFTGRFAFFGHSLGAIIAYEVARRLRERGRTGPARLFASARRAPQIPLSHPPCWNLPDAEFQARLMALNGTPSEVFRDQEVLDLTLPALRADFRLDETYVHVKPDVRLSCPIKVFGGTTDAEIPIEDLAAWRAVTTAPVDLRMFDGDHFFIQTQRTALIDAVAHSLRSL